MQVQNCFLSVCLYLWDVSDNHCTFKNYVTWTLKTLITHQCHEESHQPHLRFCHILSSAFIFSLWVTCVCGSPQSEAGHIAHGLPHFAKVQKVLLLFFCDRRQILVVLENWAPQPRV